MSEAPGRSCPLHYRYAPQVFASPASPGLGALDVLYAVGGLYGNELALQRVLQLFERERGNARLVFNGDFHWFDAEPTWFERVQREVLAFDVLRGSLKVGRVEWPLLGEHNQLNALAAIGAAEHQGVELDAACVALASFRNVRRRLELRGEVAGVKVYDDFAHHPTAMRTTVDGLRRKVGLERILAVFEPRSNTMKLGAMKAQLPWALEQADLSYCLQGNYGWDAAEALAPMGAQAAVADNVEKLVGQVAAAARPGDHVLCMSNGGFGGIHDKLLAALRGRS